jgi:hypothetical protein
VFSHICAANVTIDINQQRFDFTTLPRLNEVLSKVADDQNWYWPAANLFRLDTKKAIKLRSTLVAKLKFMQLSASDEQAERLKSLIEQINNWQLADRIQIQLDYDLVQTNLQFNPRFNEGNYRLELVERPNSFHIVGLIEQATNGQLQPEQCLGDYIHAHFSSLDNQDYVFIIQPDGHSYKFGIAYWNASCNDIMPGSQVYIPLAESQFFKENTELNEQVIALAKNRILQ